jgi:hypothetical protein
MAKFYGVIGYAEGTVETDPGVWEDSLVEFHIFWRCHPKYPKVAGRFIRQ